MNDELQYNSKKLHKSCANPHTKKNPYFIFRSLKEILLYIWRKIRYLTQLIASTYKCIEMIWLSGVKKQENDDNGAF